MKKGYTLVELLATLVVLAIIGLIAFPVIDGTIKNGKEDLYKAQLQEIEDATEKWAYLNLDLLQDNGQPTTVKLEDLKKAGLIQLDVRDPRNNQLLDNEMLIVITCNNNVCTYNVNEETGSSTSSEYNENSPVLVLNGNPLEYVEFGTEYSELGTKAKDRNGNLIDETKISKMYQYDGKEIGEVATNEFKTYTIVYSVTNEVDGKLYTSSITRTVIVRDTIAPTIEVPVKVNISFSTASKYNETKLLEDVNIIDNDEYTVKIEGFEYSVGEKFVSYTACDTSNNCTTKKRIINILSDDVIDPDIAFEISEGSLTLKPSEDFDNTESTYVWYKDGSSVSLSKNYELTDVGTYQLQVTTGDVVRKSSKLEVLGYQLKNDKVLFAAKKDDNCILRRNGSYEIEVFNYNDKCTITTALNMVKNGYLEYKDNTNFPDFTYNAAEDALFISERKEFKSPYLIPIDYNKTYIESVEMKNTSQVPLHYVGMVEYDIDKEIIFSKNVLTIKDTLTYLTQDLKNGDTVVYLNDISNFSNSSSTLYYQLGFIFWNYKDSTGYTYPELTYSRNIYHSLYEYTGINKESNTITLKKPWPYGTITSGTKLSQSNDTTTYNYGILSNKSLSSDYMTYTNTISGRNEITHQVTNSKFRYGTEYISFLMLHDYNSSGAGTTYIKNIVITEED